MKYFFACLFGFCFLNMFSQNNVFIITEKFDGMISAPTYDSIFVTDPSGVTNVQVIPHLNVSLKSHNSALNIIFNNVTEQGYKMVENGPMQLGFNSPAYYTHTWYFCQPWTSAGLEPAGANNSPFQILKVFPNPCKNLVNVSFLGNTDHTTLVVINTAGYILDKMQLNGSDCISIDFTKYPRSTYFVRLFSARFYSEAIKVVKE